MTDCNEAWRPLLILTPTGKPRPLLANAIIAFREAPAWQGVLAYNEFRRETVIERHPPWDAQTAKWVERPWTDHDDLLATDWLQKAEISVQSKITAQAVEVVARDRPFHPVREYLSSLQYDGIPRLDTWLSTCWGAERTSYTATIGRAMMIAAVARIDQPGCKVDTVPIFESDQGKMKSTAIKALFDPWFTDELADLGSKDAAMQTRGVWGIEVSELDSMARTDVSRIKAFITRTLDRFRPPYGSRLLESPRSCVFWGTTNSDAYLKDETGGRRFWPVKSGKINIALLREIRDQLWAEAVVLYEAGEPWWITKKETMADAERHQRDRYVGDPWDEIIGSYMDLHSEVTIDEVLRSALSLEIGRCGQLEMNRVARSLRALGCHRFQARTSGGKRVWKYRKPATEEEHTEIVTTVTTLRLVTGDT
jgi:predicted P-loop ATPase